MFGRRPFCTTFEAAAGLGPGPRGSAIRTSGPKRATIWPTRPADASADEAISARIPSPTWRKSHRRPISSRPCPSASPVRVKRRICSPSRSAREPTASRRQAPRPRQRLRQGPPRLLPARSPLSASLSVPQSSTLQHGPLRRPATVRLPSTRITKGKSLFYYYYF